jgi:hypothetical protein
MARIRKGHWGTLGDLESYHPVGDEGWVASVAGVDYVFTGGRWVDAIDAGGGNATLSQDDRDAIASVTALTAQIESEGAELTAGESVGMGDQRNYTVGDVSFTLTNRGAKRTVANPITVAEINKWTIGAQSPVLSYTYPANLITPKGYRLQQADGSGLVAKATFTAGATIDLTKWTVDVKATTTIDDWIANEGNAHSAGQRLLTGDARRMVTGTTAVQITYRGDNIDSCPALSVAELTNWEYVGQNAIPTTYPGAGLAIKGLQYRLSTTGQLFQVKANVTLAATFDVTQWDIVGEGKTVREVVGGSVDALALLDAPENLFVLSGCTVDNGPGNAAQNVSGSLTTVGDGKNGIITLTITAGDSVSAIGGTWLRRVTTPTGTNPVTDIGSWARTPLNAVPVASTNNATVCTGTSVLWDLSHNITTAFTMDGPLTLIPKTDWSTRTGTITFSGTSSGSLPPYGTDPVSITYSPTGVRWPIPRIRQNLKAGVTVHNFGVAAVTVLKGVDHNLGEAHIEGGGNYSIAASDWFDGMSIRFTHTAGRNTTERLVVTGFAGAYLRDGQSRDISTGLFIGRQDCQFIVTITENGGVKYINIDDKSPDAFAIWDYPPTGTTGAASAWQYSLISLASGVIVKANGVAPNAVAATHYIDAWDGTLTPLYGDGKIFTLPTAVATAPIGSDLYLGANGIFSTASPDITPGSGTDNIRQPVAMVLRGGKGVIKFRAAARVV